MNPDHTPTNRGNSANSPAAVRLEQMLHSYGDQLISVHDALVSLLRNECASSASALGIDPADLESADSLIHSYITRLTPCAVDRDDAGASSANPVQPPVPARADTHSWQTVAVIRRPGLDDLVFASKQFPTADQAAAYADELDAWFNHGPRGKRLDICISRIGPDPATGRPFHHRDQPCPHNLRDLDSEGRCRLCGTPA